MLTVRSVVILAAVTLAAVLGAGAAVLLRQQATLSTAAGDIAFADLQKRFADIAAIDLAWRKDDAVERLSLTLDAGVWKIAEKGGYPADPAKVRAFVLALSELRLVEPKTSDPERYARLGVGDVETPGSEALEVRVEDKTGKPILGVLVGKTREGAGGEMLYLRNPAEARSWLAAGRVSAEKSVAAWTDGKILDLGQKRMQEIRLAAADGAVLEVRRKDDSDRPFAIVGMPEDRELASFYTINEIVDGLAELPFEDVRPLSGLSFDQTLGNAVYQTKDGLTVIVDFARLPGPKGAEEIWTHYAVQAATDAGEDVKREGEALKARLDGWAFRLADHRLARLRHTLETATKPKQAAGG